MSEKKKGVTFEVDELDDAALEEASGGLGVNVSCPTTNTCNMVAGCGTSVPTTKPSSGSS